MSQPADQAEKLWKGTLPTHGVITSGPLADWRYAFLQFIRIDDTVAMDLRCSEPSWPFPVTVRFLAGRDEFGLRAIAGERAKRLDANALIERCFVDGVARSPFETI